jgi:ribose transport system permease protein
VSSHLADSRRLGIHKDVFGWVGLLPLVLLVIFAATYAAVNPGVASAYQLQTIAEQATPLAVISLGQLLVVLTGGIDLSLASIFSLSGVTFVSLLGSSGGHLPLVAAFCAVALGMGCGLLNGFFVAIGKMPAIVATLATSFVFAALANEVLSEPGGLVNDAVRGKLVGQIEPRLPTTFIWLIGTTLALWLFLGHTVIGRAIYGSGSNAAGVVSLGLSARTAKLTAFALAGGLAALAAILLAGSTASGDPNSGDPYLLNSVAAVALGGASFAGGIGSVTGTVCGAIILALMGNLLFFAGINSYWQYVIGSVIIIAAVGAPVIIRTALRPREALLHPRNS